MWWSDVLEIDITKDPGEIVNPGDEVIDTPSEDTPPSVEDTKVDVEDKTTPPAKKEPIWNKSNFKKLSVANKAKDKEIANLKAQLANKWDDVDIDTDDDIEDDDTVDFDKEFNDELQIEESEEQKLKRNAKDAMEKFPGMTVKEAITYAKAQEPAESRSHTNFNTKSTVVPKTMKVKDLTPEQVAQTDLSPEQLDAWTKANETSVNPFAK